MVTWSKWMRKHFPQLAERSLRSTWDFQIYMTIYIPFKDFIRIIILAGRHRNMYCLNLKKFNWLSQSYHSSLSYIIGQSDFDAKDLKRDLKSKAADRNSSITRGRFSRLPHTPFFAITCFFAITLKNYKLCYSKLNWSLM